MNPVRAFHYVYILLSEKSDEWYIGCTSNLRRRINEHNEGKSVYTRSRGPYKLIYYEACLNKGDAFARERYLKTGIGKRYVKNRLKKYFVGALTG